MSRFDQFAEFQLDVLKEVGNIGAGNAATALSNLLNRPIDMKVPNVQVIPFSEVSQLIGGSEQVVVAIFFRVVGDAPGNLFFILSRSSAKRLMKDVQLTHVDELAEADDGFEFSELELSALEEIGNILAGSFLSSLADFTSLRMAPTVPALSIDMADAILSFGFIQYSQMGDNALLINTSFIRNEQDQVSGQFFLIPDPDAFEKIFQALGVPLE